MQWNLEAPEMPERAVSLDILRPRNFFFLALTASFFRQNVT